MTLFNKRCRMVSIRLSDEEYRKLHEACSASGARSVSDLAREAMHLIIDGKTNGHGPAKLNGAVDERLDEMHGKLESLQAEVARLSAVVGGGR
jgi:hypothetical protein